MSRKKDFEVYGDLLLQYRPTIRSLIYNILYKKFIEKNRAKESFYNSDARFNLPKEYIPYSDLEYLAIIKNNKVIEIIRVNSDTAKIITDKEISFVKFNPENEIVKIKMSYENEKFIENKDIDEKD